MAPGWIRTALGGDEAPLSIEETIPHLVAVLLAKQQRPGLEYLDYQGKPCRGDLDIPDRSMHISPESERDN
jgi:hypothetical protein